MIEAAVASGESSKIPGSDQRCTKEEAIVGQIQDLSTFKMPPGLRGRSAWFVQIWGIAQALFFHLSPQVLYGWRRFLLRLFGAHIGKGVVMRPSVTVTYPWNLTIGDWSWIGDQGTLYIVGEVGVGENAVVSQHSYLFTRSHDYTRSAFNTLVAPIRIDSNHGWQRMSLSVQELPLAGAQ